METYRVTVTGTVDADGPDEALDLVQSGEWSPDLDGASVDTEPLSEVWDIERERSEFYAATR